MTSHSGFLYLMAIADSYCMKYEFVNHAQDKMADDLIHGPHPKFTDYPIGHYTDDTQMTLANAELMLEKKILGETSYSVKEFVNKWLEAFKRDPHQGYSTYLYNVMMQAQSAEEFLKSIDPKKSLASGAAMRAGCFGLLSDVEKVKELSIFQAKITHDNACGVHSALAVALSVHFLYHGGDQKYLARFLEKHICTEWNAEKYGRNDETGNGLKIVTQALKAVTEATSLSDVLLRVVNNDALSDTDTIGAIAMVIASRVGDLPNDLPDKLTEGLENGAYGAAHLKAMDEILLKAFPPTSQYLNRAYFLKPRSFHPK